MNDELYEMKILHHHITQELLLYCIYWFYNDITLVVVLFNIFVCLHFINFSCYFLTRQKNKSNK